MKERLTTEVVMVSERQREQERMMTNILNRDNRTAITSAMYIAEYQSIINKVRPSCERDSFADDADIFRRLKEYAEYYNCNAVVSRMRKLQSEAAQRS